MNCRSEISEKDAWFEALIDKFRRINLESQRLGLHYQNHNFKEVQSKLFPKFQQSPKKHAASHVLPLHWTILHSVLVHF